MVLSRVFGKFLLQGDNYQAASKKTSCVGQVEFLDKIIEDIQIADQCTVTPVHVMLM